MSAFIVVRCPYCNARSKARADLEGKAGKCPKCGKRSLLLREMEQPKPELSAEETADYNWLVKTLRKGDDPWSQDVASPASDRLGYGRAVALLIRAIEADPDDDVRYRASCALHSFKSPEAFRALALAFMRTENKNTWWQLKDTLERFGKRAEEHPSPAPRSVEKIRFFAVRLEELAKLPAERRRLVCLAWESVGDFAAIWDLVLLLRGLGSGPRGEAAAQVLIELTRPEPVPRLVRWLECDEEEVRAAVCDVLRAMRDPRSLKPLIARLKDADLGVRLKACEALAALADERAVKPLIKALKDKDCSVRENACEALAKLGGRQAVKALSRMTRDEEFSVARAACLGLGESGDVRAVKPLRQVRQADSRTWEHPGLVKGGAEDALRKLGENGVFEAIVALVEDEEDATAAIGRKLLGASSDPRALEPLERELGKLKKRRQTDGLRYADTRKALQQLVAELGIGEKRPKDQLKPVQDIQPGDFFVARGQLRHVYGRCTERSSDIAIIAYCHSELCPQGELGQIPISRIAKIISEEEFNKELSRL